MKLYPHGAKIEMVSYRDSYGIRVPDDKPHASESVAPGETSQRVGIESIRERGVDPTELCTTRATKSIKRSPGWQTAHTSNSWCRRCTNSAGRSRTTSGNSTSGDIGSVLALSRLRLSPWREPRIRRSCCRVFASTGEQIQLHRAGIKDKSLLMGRCLPPIRYSI